MPKEKLNTTIIRKAYANYYLVEYWTTDSRNPKSYLVRTILSVKDIPQYALQLYLNNNKELQ